jgi:hypothetical protein
MSTIVTCPECETPRVGDDAFCEGCGYDFVAGTGREPALGGGPAAPAAWHVEVCADRAYFERLQPDDVAYPVDRPPLAMALDQPEVRVGRTSASRGTEPELDLGGEPVDPAISHLHAAFVRDDAGSYSVVDRGSTNGTYLNEATEPIEPGELHPVRDGDRVHVGAWTTITVRAGALEHITEEAVRR